MSIFAPEAIQRALYIGHQDCRLADLRRRDCKQDVRMTAAPQRRADPPEPGQVRSLAAKKKFYVDERAKYMRAGEKRIRRVVDRIVAEAVVSDEPHPELMAQSINGCQVYFCEQDREPETVAERWNLIAGGSYA